MCKDEKENELYSKLFLNSNRFGVNIKDVNDRTPIHSAFRLSNNISNNENQFEIETDFGNKVLNKYI